MFGGRLRVLLAVLGGVWEVSWYVGRFGWYFRGMCVKILKNPGLSSEIEIRAKVSELCSHWK